MLLKVLVENNTLIDQYYLGEPGISFYIEDEERKILFDTGYSDILLKNAMAMGISLQDVDTIVCSHGHDDHTKGLKYLIQEFELCNTKIVAHPDCFLPKMDGKEYFGAPYQIEELHKLFHVILTKSPYKISEHITFLGEIPNSNSFEHRSRIGFCKREEKLEEDYLMDDSAIVYQDNEGLFIITGCSHSGICNIIEYAKKVCGDNRISGVIGGFHLFQTDEVLEKTIQYMIESKVKQLYPCHCVSFQVKAKMNEVLQVNEVGVGMEINL